MPEPSVVYVVNIFLKFYEDYMVKVRRDKTVYKHKISYCRRVFKYADPLVGDTFRRKRFYLRLHLCLHLRSRVSPPTISYISLATRPSTSHQSCGHSSCVLFWPVRYNRCLQPPPNRSQVRL